MTKFAKFNRNDLTPIQIQERARRKRERIKMHGIQRAHIHDNLPLLESRYSNLQYQNLSPWRIWD